VLSSSQRPLPDNTQHSQLTNIHASDGIRTHDLSRWAAAELRLRPRGHLDRHLFQCMRLIWIKCFFEDPQRKISTTRIFSSRRNTIPLLTYYWKWNKSIGLHAISTDYVPFWTQCYTTKLKYALLAQDMSALLINISTNSDKA